MEDLVANIASLHENAIVNWTKQQHISFTQENFLKLVEENHAFNYQLWYAEDRARRDDLGFQFVYDAKREIDRHNQQRNNRMEMMDNWLFNELQPASHLIVPVHSETPGMMIDRLSILALKAYHMMLQVNRDDVNATHRDTCRNKLSVLEEQQNQLQNCLQHLLEDIGNQRKTFRVYHQFKMYNDPNLNPQLYKSKELI